MWGCYCCCVRRPQRTELLLDEPLSIKTIRFAAYNVVKNVGAGKEEKYWAAAVSAVGGHRLDLNFTPKYSPQRFIQLKTSCSEILVHARYPDEMFHFIDENSYNV